MLKSQYTRNYINHYLNIQNVYPSVFSLKMFLGRNPDLNLRGLEYSGKTILDVGFGDGRDLILFHNLGFEVFGVEVDEAVVTHTEEKLVQVGVKANLQVGYNDETGFKPNRFDFVFSCASLMYLRDSNSTIHKILRHMYEITKPRGYFLGTLTRFDSHITKDSTKIDENRILCKDPFYKQREGQLYWLHHSKEEIAQDLLSAGFKDCKVYNYDVDWFGTRETAFIFFAIK